MNSAGLANLAAVATQHAIITLDPLRVAGAPEYVIVTAHTGSATSATITRAAYGSTAREHLLGTAWVHAPITDDYIRIVDATADVTDPYEGQLVYEQDVDTYWAYTGAVWQAVVTLGAWSSWTPTYANFTVGNATVVGRYAQVGRVVHYRLAVTLGSTSTMGSAPAFSLPVTAVAGYLDRQPIGQVLLKDTGTADHTGQVWASTTLLGTLVTLDASGTYLKVAQITATVPFTWATGDIFMCTGTYEAAA